MSGQNWVTVRTVACLMASVLVIAYAARASTSPEPTIGRGFGFVYDPVQEITLVGTVKRLVSQPAGSPIGLHLLIFSDGKVVDVHLGPYVAKENQQALRAGELVQVIGVNENVHGKNILLARQLVFHGRLVTVRNERGFLVRNLESSRKIHDGRPVMNGGIQ